MQDYWTADVPYRAILPQAVEGLLVVVTRNHWSGGEWQEGRDR
jgi:hypothetical protein